MSERATLGPVEADRISRAVMGSGLEPEHLGFTHQPRTNGSTQCAERSEGAARRLGLDAGLLPRDAHAP